MLAFTVYGKPEPQGSTRAFVVKGRPVITSANKGLKAWRQQVSAAALAAVAGTEFITLEPVSVAVDFYFDRPKSVKRAAMTVRPDVDKTLRGVFDALTGIVFKDDAQVVRSTATKQYGSPARAEITIEVLS